MKETLDDVRKVHRLWRNTLFSGDNKVNFVLCDEN